MHASCAHIKHLGRAHLQQHKHCFCQLACCLCTWIPASLGQHSKNNTGVCARTACSSSSSSSTSWILRHLREHMGKDSTHKTTYSKVHPRNCKTNPFSACLGESCPELNIVLLLPLRLLLKQAPAIADAVFLGIATFCFCRATQAERRRLRPDAVKYKRSRKCT